MYGDLLRSVNIISASISSQFYPVSFLVNGVVGTKRILRQYNYSRSIPGGGDQLSDFRSRLSNRTLNDGNSTYSIRVATTICRQELDKENMPKLIVMLTDKDVGTDVNNLLNGWVGIKKDTYVFSLRTERVVAQGLFSSEMNSFKQLTKRRSLSKRRVGSSWKPVTTDFFEPYLVDLASRKCKVNPPPPTPTPVPFSTDNKLVTKQLEQQLDKLPFGQPRITKAADLPVFNTSQTKAESAVDLRDSLEFLVFEEVRLTDPSIEIKSVVGIVQKSIITSRMVREEEPSKVAFVACTTKRCAAKVLLDFTKSVKRTAVKLASDKLRNREGFQDVFISKSWTTVIKKKKPNGKRWEVEYLYKLKSNGDR